MSGVAELKLGAPVLYADRVDSTMRWAREELSSGSVGPGAVFVAGSQSAGRGRHGRSWVSLPGKGLYLTVVLPGTLAAPALTLAAALALAEAAEDCFDLRSSIKWPNDLLLAEGKWAGTLAEVVTDGVLLGIGANLNHSRSDLAAGLAPRATSLALALGRRVEGERLFQDLLSRLEQRLTAFGRGGFPAIADAYRERSTFQPGDLLDVTVGEDDHRIAVFRELDAEGRLVLNGWDAPLASAAVLNVRRKSDGATGPRPS